MSDRLLIKLSLHTTDDIADYVWELSEYNENLPVEFIEHLAREAAERIEGDRLLDQLGEAVSTRLGEQVNAVLAAYPDVATMTPEGCDRYLYRTFSVEVDGVRQEVRARVMKAASMKGGCTRCGNSKRDERALRTLYCTGGGCYCVSCLFTKYSRLVKDAPEREADPVGRLADWLHRKLDPLTLASLLKEAGVESKAMMDAECAKDLDERDAGALALAGTLYDFIAACGRNGTTGLGGVPEDDPVH